MKKKIHGAKFCIFDADHASHFSLKFEKTIGENHLPLRGPRPQPHSSVSSKSVDEANDRSAFIRIPISKAQSRVFRDKGFVYKIDNNGNSIIIYQHKTQSISFASRIDAATIGIGENSTDPPKPKPLPAVPLSVEKNTSCSRKKHISRRYTTTKFRR